MLITPRRYYRHDVQSGDYYFSEVRPSRFWEAVEIADPAKYQFVSELNLSQVDGLLRASRAKIISPTIDELPVVMGRQEFDGDLLPGTAAELW